MKIYECQETENSIQVLKKRKFKKVENFKIQAKFWKNEITAGSISILG